MSEILAALLESLKNMPPFAGGMDKNSDFTEFRKTANVSSIPPIESILIEQRVIAGVPCEILTPEKLASKDVIFYIHGGGFFSGDTNSSRGYGTTLADEFGVTVVTISYRTCPENVWPAGLNDCFDVYKALLTMYPESKLCLMGESAGANFVLTTTLKARDEGLAMPQCIVCYSPLTNFAEEFPSREKNAGALIISDPHINDFIASLYLPDGANRRNPYISPYYADVKGLPPTYFVADSGEILLDDSLMLAEKMNDVGCSVRVDVLQNTFHSFPTMGRLCEESIECLKNTRKYLEDFFDVGLKGN